jgi:apolipoprotein N-acyltransferase
MMAVRLVRGAAWVRGLKGWRQSLFAFAAGAGSALGFPPFYLFPLLLLGLAALVLLLDNAARRLRPVRGGLVVGWWFGFGQFLVGLHWIGFAFMVDAADHAWQLPFVAVLFPGGLALFPAFACAAAVSFRCRGAARILGFALCYGIAEWLRGHVLTGFPWNIAGYGWGASLAVLQSAAWFGVYGLSLLTVLFGASLAALFRGRPQWKLPLAMTVLFGLFFIGGSIRLALHPTVAVPGVHLRIVQPNIPQAEKYQPQFMARNWLRLTDLSMAPAAQRPSVVIWPEAAPPFILPRVPEAMDWVDNLNAHGTLLMTGTVRFEHDDDGEIHFYNSFLMFGHGTVLAVYDKTHLVPFGEYLPFEATLDRWGLKKLTGIAGSFGRGKGPRTFQAPGVPDFGPLICYEILFPGEVVGARRPDWFVNVTDDSWFGPWAGPRQHLLVAQVRAIEEGIPVVRAANTGISAIIDPLGRITTRLGLNQSGALDGDLPSKVDKTQYSVLSSVWFWMIAGAILATIWLFCGRK